MKERTGRKSHRVGRAMFSDGTITTAYRALVQHKCTQCAETIPPGALFARRSQHATWPAIGTVTTMPVCVACRPLRLDSAGSGDAD